MSFSTFVARRYMQMGGGNRFFSWITILSISGVMIGVAAMIVVWSVINGFETELRQRFLISNAHILLYRFPSGIENFDVWEQAIQKDFPEEIQGLAPFVYYETMASKGHLLHSAVVRGTDPVKRVAVQDLRPIIYPPAALDIITREMDPTKIPKYPSVIVGTGLLENLQAKIGDTIELVRPDEGDLSTMGSFKVIAAYESGLKHYDTRTVIMSLPAAQKFFGMGHSVTGIEVGLKDPWASEKLEMEMRNRYSLSVREWQSLNRPLFEAMKMERIVILLITALVAGVAGFNILTTIFVAVAQKQRDISIIKALGARGGQILSVFIQQGAMIGLVGSVLGMGLAFGISKLLERYQFVDLPDLYLLAKLPLSYDWWVYTSVAGGSLVIAVLAGIFPALKASRVDPVAGFRGNV